MSTSLSDTTPSAFETFVNPVPSAAMRNSCEVRSNGPSNQIVRARALGSVGIRIAVEADVEVGGALGEAAAIGLYQIVRESPLQ